MIFGLIPALRAATDEVRSALNERAAATGQAGRWRTLRHLLVVPQIALSLAVLICATLSLRSLQELSRVDLGFEPSRVLIAPLSLVDAGYDELRGRAFYSQLLDRVGELPGVESASLAQISPFGGGLGSPVRPTPESEVTEFGFNRIGPKHFLTLATPLLRGRDFGSDDVAGGPSVTIINATAAQFWPDGDAVGRQLMLRTGLSEWQPFEVIGIVGDSRSSGLTDPVRPTMYVPLSQFYAGYVTLHVRSAIPSAGLPSAVRDVLQRLDSSLPVEVTSLHERISRTLVAERMTSWLLTAFGLLALMLASLGIYGVLAFAVSQRTHEIGVRTALGARRTDVLALILRQGMTMTGAGLVIGLALAFFIAGLLRALLFNVSPTDPLTFTAIPLLLVGEAVIACWLPARRAARIDPLEALRRG
jgi:predicted permease